MKLPRDYDKIKRRNFTVRISEESLGKLTETALKLNVSRQLLLNMMLAEYLENDFKMVIERHPE